MSNAPAPTRAEEGREAGQVAPKNRSGEELAMRDALDRWGRARWPDARVVHELVVGSCRIDMAFVTPSNLIGVEIKSSRDTLDRLEAQEKAFIAAIPELWLAIAPRWQDRCGEIGYGTGVLVVADGSVDHTVRAQTSRSYEFRRDPRVRLSLTVPMLDLLWRDELHAVAARCGAWATKGKPSRPVLIGAIARKLTGDEIVAQVCRELRARDAFWRADPPIVLPGIAASDLPGSRDLFRSTARTALEAPHADN